MFSVTLPLLFLFDYNFQFSFTATLTSDPRVQNTSSPEILSLSRSLTNSRQVNVTFIAQTKPPIQSKHQFKKRLPEKRTWFSVKIKRQERRNQLTQQQNGYYLLISFFGTFINFVRLSICQSVYPFVDRTLLKTDEKKEVLIKFEEKNYLK